MRLARHGNARQAAIREDLPEGLRYFAQRLVEAADVDSGLLAGGTLHSDPLTLLGEALEVEGLVSAGDPSAPYFRVRYDLLERLLAVCRDDRDLKIWYPRELGLLLAALEAVTPAAARKANARHQDQLVLHANRLYRAMEVLLGRMRRSYRSQLLRVICLDGRLLDTAGAVLRTEGRSQALVSVLVNQGRADPTTVDRMVTSMVVGSDGLSIFERLRRILSSLHEEYEVLFVVRGARTLVRGDDWGCRPLTAVDRWRVTSGTHANARLQEAVAQADGAAMTVGVSALHVGDAVDRASAAAQAFLAQLNAQHRIVRFDLSVPLMCARPGGLAGLPEPRARQVDARPVAIPRERRIEEAVHYLHLAARERGPVVAAMHAWTSLEALVIGAGAPSPNRNRRIRSRNPYDILTSGIAEALAVLGLRSGFLRLWKIVRAEGMRGPRASDFDSVASWLGTKSNGRFLDANPWFDAVRAMPQMPPSAMPKAIKDASSAGEALAHIAPDLPPLARGQLEFYRWICARQVHALDHVRAVATALSGEMARTYRLRNAAVHNGLFASTGDKAIARSSSMVGDALVELLLNWLEPEQPSTSGEALDLAIGRAGFLRSRWANDPSARLDINANSLMRQGGDGITRS